MFKPFRYRAVAQWASWAVVLWVIVFWRLGYLSLLDPDEAHYGQLTREMIRAHQWFVPLLNGVPYIDKPVLYHWLQAAAQWAFGETEFALRLPSACAAVAAIWTVWWTGRSLFGAPVGRTAALMFATTPLTFALSGLGVFDMVYTAFLFGALASLIVGGISASASAESAGWLLLALAVMVKGPVAALLIILFGVLLWALPATRSVAARLHWGLGLLLVAIVAAPWFIYMAVAYPQQFVRDYLLAGNLWYFTRPAVFSTRQSDALFYARTYLGACFPWSVLAVGVAVDTAWKKRQPSSAEWCCWLWTALIIGFFSLAGFKLDTYIFPAAPTTCLLVALAFHAPAFETGRRATHTAASICATALIVGGLLLAATMFRIDLDLSKAAALLPVALIAGGVLALIAVRRVGIAALAPVLVSTLLIVYSVVLMEGFPVLERSRPTAPIGRWIDRHAPKDVPVGVYGLDDWHASIRFYARRPLVVLNNETDVTAFVREHPDSYVLMLRSDLQAFRKHGVPVRRVGGRRAIVGRRGKYIRHQVWGRIVVTAPVGSPMLAVGDADVDIPDN